MKMAEKDDNITDMEDARSAKKARKKPPPKPKGPPLFNIPPTTKWLAVAMVAVFFVQEISMTVTGKVSFFNMFGFIPTNLTDFVPELWPSLFSPITYMFIHGSLTHIFMNVAMLLAFGSGLEKWLGRKKFLLLFFGSGLIAILVHYILNNYSPEVVIGASGATSGLFAAGIIMLRNLGSGIGSGPYGIYPLIALFIVITVLFAFTGSPDGSAIAWQAHLGGFAGGLLFMKLFRKL